MRGSYILPAESSGSRLGRPGGLLVSGLLAILLASQARSALAGAPPTTTPTITPTTTQTSTRTPTLTPTLTPTTRTSDVRLQKSGAPNPVKRGETLTYTLIIDNLGPHVSFNASANDTLPPEVVFLSCTVLHPVPDDSCNGPPVGSNGTVGIRISNLTGTPHTFVIAVSVIAASGTIVNTASVGGSSADPNLNNNQATVITTIEPEPTSTPTSTSTPTPTHPAPTPTPTPSPPAVAALSPGGLALFAAALIAAAFVLIRRGS